MRTVPELATLIPFRAGSFTLDASVADLETSLEVVAKHVATKTGVRLPPEDVRIVGHCIGGALVAQAVAQGRCGSKHIVLSTLGLFFKVGVEGWLKGNDSVLDTALSTHPQAIISAGAATEPSLAWPPELEERFRIWRELGMHHGCGNPFCERVAFMYGMPFRVDDMPDLHDGVGDDGLAGQFGAMALATYAHCLRNLRRGWAAPFDAQLPKYNVYVDGAARERFRDRNITLITGNENQVWHRNSIDVMYEWLNNGPRPPGLTVRKKVLPRYGHQDLYWSTNARRDVYPLIAEGLGV